VSFAPIRYLAYARREFHAARHDLASSGTPELPAAELGPPERPDDYSAWGRYLAALSRRYDVPEVEIVPALGASGGMFVAYASLCQPGERVLVETPTYEPLVATAQALGLRVERFARRRDRGFALDPDEIGRALGPGVRAVVLSDLHNPSGVAADTHALIALARLLEARDAYLIVDEVYGDLRELQAPGSPRSARCLGPNVAAVGSLTKQFGLSWARAGFVFLPPEAAMRAREVVTHAAGHLPPVTAAYGARALERVDMLEQRRRSLLAGKRSIIDAWLARQGDRFVWTPSHPEAPFGFVVETGARAQHLFERLERGARERGVLVAPGEFFDDPAGFRLAWNLPAAALPEALAQLELALA
jgi:aspartate/methionine/tyrosine aminotransferase